MSKEISTQLNVQFIQADTLDNITSRENISTSFGKLATWFDEIDEKIDTEATYNDVEALFGRFLTFQGTESFTFGTESSGKWNGTVEYSTDLGTWETWNGTTTLSSGTGNVLYLRGKNNTRFATSTNDYTQFVFTTTGTIACNGDIRRLLDYENPEDTTMDEWCYTDMFLGCTSLTKAPDLPATTLASACYYGMFNGCTSLTTVPALPATTLANNCYMSMFQNCKSLTKAPELPAKTLTPQCYMWMFYGCTALATLPALPATTLASKCYYQMFQNCTNIKISTTKTGDYQTPYRIPTSGTGSVSTTSMGDMFTRTGGTFTGTPTINTTYYTSNTVVSAS